MVTEWLLTALQRTVEWIVWALPAPDLPADWFSEVTDFVGTLNGYAAWFDSWVPWPVVAVAIPVVILAWGIANAIRIAMKLLSFITLGGGAT